MTRGPLPATTRRSTVRRLRLVAILALQGLLAFGLLRAFASTPPLFADGFSGADRLISNELAFEGRRGVPASHHWRVTSGSWFTHDGTAWTGIPDAGPPDVRSRVATGSVVFRAVTRRRDFGDVTVGLDLRNLRVVDSPRTPPRSIDGVHLMLRYRSAQELYYVSVNRRDGMAVIKKKVPGGPSNGGQYYRLGRAAAVAIPFGSVQRVRASVHDVGATVVISLSIDGRPILRTVDRGKGGPPFLGPGGVGIRGDNDEFTIDNFVVRGYDAP